MRDDYFKILGIQPTTDARAIRNAYVRLARIYHPDRFVGMSEDVRVEAERRMKEATAAYESLRAARKVAAKKSADTPISKRRKKDAWDEVKRVREEAENRRLEAERSRVRWLLWEELEREARERAAYEASLVSLDQDPVMRVAEEPKAAVGETPESALSRRLKAARTTPGDSIAQR